MLTSADVEQKTFSTALRGYDLDEVDDFLDEVVATLRKLDEDIETARSSATNATVTAVPVAPPSEPAAPIDESAIGRALLAAQNAADQLLAEARDEAARIVSSAQGEAETWQADREAKRAEAEAELASLSSRIAAIRSELAVLAGQVADKLDEMDALVNGGALSTDAGEQADLGMEEEVEGDGDEPGPPGTEGSSDDGHGYQGDGENSSEDQASGGSDRLDEILSGVATDLRLGGEADEEIDEDE